MEILETIISWKGLPVKISGGKVYVRAFGSTGPSNREGWSWLKVPLSALQPDLLQELKERKLIE